jgi:alanyl-tRNA synthetase
MTNRLYYRDSFLHEFDAEVVDVLAPVPPETRTAVVLDCTAFYPTSGGQGFDTGWLSAPGDAKGRNRVGEVSESADGKAILHFLESAPGFAKGSPVHGVIDAARRRDHMQQHSGQHVLSAAFVRLLNLPTVSFHMGTESCSIDLDTRSLSSEQVEAAERLANQVIGENRAVGIRFVTPQQARDLGLRKLPPMEKDELRLIDIQDFDLTACGGTHVGSTGQIGCILLRKTEKVKHGIRVEFACGPRALAAARRDYEVLTDAAGLLSSHIWDVAQQVRKSLDEAKAQRKTQEQLLEELVELHAERLLSETPLTGQRKLVVRIYSDRDLAFIRLLAQKLTRQPKDVVALLGSRFGVAALVFGQSAGQPFDMDGLMKEALARPGGRGGGSKDLAQGGPAQADALEKVLSDLAARLRLQA